MNDEPDARCIQGEPPSKFLYMIMDTFIITDWVNHHEYIRNSCECAHYA